ncbi:MAG: GntR family transcriptional regulator [Microbacterium sp.]
MARNVSDENAADIAHARLRDAILGGRLRPDQRLVEVDLAEELGVSRTPLAASPGDLPAPRDGQGRRRLPVHEPAGRGALRRRRPQVPPRLPPPRPPARRRLDPAPARHAGSRARRVPRR